MNEITMLREAGPESPALTAAARSAARAALLTEIESAGARSASRRRLPSRKVRLRVGIGVVTAAAAWAAAVVIAAPEPVGPPPSSVTLVAFEPPTFPFTVDPTPAGLTPSYSADPGNVLHAGYTGSGDDALYVTVTPEEPEQYDVRSTDDVDVNGREAEVVTGSTTVCGGPGPECVDVESPYTHVVLEWQDDQWVQLSGDGRYAERDALLEVATLLVARPQAVPLQVHVAPVGWSVLAYKDDRILTLVDDDYEQQTLSVHIPLPEEVLPADQLRESLMGPVGPVIPVTVHERPAQLVMTTTDYRVGDDWYRQWYLQAQFDDGTTFVLQAPESFTQEQVLQLAETVTYNA
jgi:hypothetical protein